MRNVVVLIRSLALLCALALAGCTKAISPDVAALSLATPILKSSPQIPDPFSQMQGNVTYLVFGGECPVGATGFEMQVNGDPWQAIPAAAGVPEMVDADHDAATGTNGKETLEADAAAAGHVWKSSCGDGSYKFWLYIHQFYALFPSVENNGVQVIRLRTVGVNTVPLEYVRPSSHSNEPARFRLNSEAWPSGFVMSNKCSVLRVGVVDGNDGLTNNHGPLPFAIKKFNQTSQSYIGSVELYDNEQSCVDQLGALDSNALTMPDGAAEMFLYYRGVAADRQVIQLRAEDTASPASIQPSNAALLAYTDINRQWGNVEGLYPILRGVCLRTSVSLLSHDIGAGWQTNNGDAITATLTGDLASAATVYSTLATCQSNSGGQPMNGFQATIANGANQTVPFYVKVSPGVSDGIQSLNVKVVLDDGATVFDVVNLWFNIDPTHDMVVGQFRINGSQFATPMVGQCVPASIDVLTASGTSIPAAAPETLVLRSSGDAGMLFYEDPSVCAADSTGTSASSSIHIQADEKYHQFYFKPSVAGDLDISGTHGSLSVTTSPIFGVIIP